MTFPIDTNIPAATNYPGDDQPRIKANFTSISGYLAVDHVAPGTANAGDHKQVTVASKNVPGGLTTDPASILYTGNGVASSVAQMFWVNQSSRFHMSAIRAWGFIRVSLPPPGPPTAQTITQTYNVASVSRTAAGNYVVTLSAGAVDSNDYAVLVSSRMTSNFLLGVIPGYTINSAFPPGPGQFQLNFASLTLSGGVHFGVDPDTFSFQVMQI